MLTTGPPLTVIVMDALAVLWPLSATEAGGMCVPELRLLWVIGPPGQRAPSRVGGRGGRARRVPVLGVGGGGGERDRVGVVDARAAQGGGDGERGPAGDRDGAGGGRGPPAAVGDAGGEGVHAGAERREGEAAAGAEHAVAAGGPADGGLEFPVLPGVGGRREGDGRALDGPRAVGRRRDRHHPRGGWPP